MKNLLTGSTVFALAVTVMLSACGGEATDSAAEALGALGGDSPQSVTPALFEGRTLNLASDWGEAKSCVVWRQGEPAKCFRTEQEGESLVAELERSAPEESALAPSPGPVLACSRSCLHLYQDSNFGGPRDLHFCDRGRWQNLTDYGFNDQLSSFKTGDYAVHLAEHTNGGGYWYPGNTGACVSAGGMSSGWNDRVSSIKIL